MIDTGELGPLYEPEKAEELEQADRANPIPGSEPACPVCGQKTARLVEAHPAPRSDDSPFRVRIVCTNDECLRWTIYDW